MNFKKSLGSGKKAIKVARSHDVREGIINAQVAGEVVSSSGNQNYPIKVSQAQLFPARQYCDQL